MWSRTTARTRGLMTPCDASLRAPVTVSGASTCIEGHAHSVQWVRGQPHVSPTGYAWAFLGALDAAEDAGIRAGNPEEPAYEAAYRAVMTARGYADVLVDDERIQEFPRA
jgi:hypothetical protein